MTTDYLINMENADLLQQMYLQDVDLGYNWVMSEPVKQVKEVDDISLEKKNAESATYIVDGETGEYIPVPQNNTATVQECNTTETTPPSFFNIDEYLEIFDNGDGIGQQQQQVQNQQTIESGSNTQNLTSLLIQPDNSSSGTQLNEDIWEDIANLSELSGLNLPTNNNSVTMMNNHLRNARVPSNPMPENSPSTVVNQTQIDQQLPLYNTTNRHFAQTESFETSPSNVYEPQTLTGYTLGVAPTAPTPPHCSPAYSHNSGTNEDGIPMDAVSRGSSPFSSNAGDMNENYLLNQLNNYQVAMEVNEPFSSGNGQSMPISATEPGQFFFDQNSNNMNKMLNDIISINTVAQSYDRHMNSPYLNPAEAPYLPPPLETSGSSIRSFSNDSDNHLSTLDNGAISEMNESDSGISMGHSPQRFGFVGDEVNLGTLQPMKCDVLTGQDPMLCLEEVKHIHHNHTYDGTLGVAKNKTKKKQTKAPQSRESRDVRRARELNIPFTLDEIVLSPVEEYNEMLARTPLTQPQQTLIKDIRRRGKNKVAAQNCRKRKIETITTMEDDVDVLRTRKQMLVDEQNSLDATKESMKIRYNNLYQQIFSSLRDEAGRPYDASRFSLEQVEGAVLLVPHSARTAGNGCQDDGHCDDTSSQTDSASNSGRFSMEHENSISTGDVVDFRKVKIEKEE